jgi:hypothetical protein
VSLIRSESPVPPCLYNSSAKLLVTDSLLILSK